MVDLSAFNVTVDDGEWAVRAGSADLTAVPLDAGTYSSGDVNGSWIVVWIPGHDCNDPSGTVTIDEISMEPDAALSKLLVTFDLQCGDGSIMGCTRFE
jgi:hypothetical protein